MLLPLFASRDNEEKGNKQELHGIKKGRMVALSLQRGTQSPFCEMLSQVLRTFPERPSLIMKPESVCCLDQVPEAVTGNM